MKAASLLVTASLILNAGLLAAFALKPAFTPIAVRDFFARHGFTYFSDHADPRVRPSATHPKPPPEKAMPLWARLHTADLPALIARLRAAGFPPAVLRAVVNAQLDLEYGPRLRQALAADGDTPYWKAPPLGWGSDQRMMEFSQINREKFRRMRELLGDDIYASYEEATEAQRRQYGNIPRGKIELLQRIRDDYADMQSQVRAAMRNITLPEDREKLALLQREERADLMALLTPEELAEYDVRNSQASMRLRSQLAFFDATEAEFRTLVQLSQGYQDRIYPTGASTPEMMTARTAAQKELAEKIKATLGEERYAEYTRATNREYQQIQRLTERENLPATTAIKAFDVREHVGRESQRIYSDPAMSIDDKRAALLNLAQSARNQLLSTLGPSAGPTYVKMADAWLSGVERGGAVTFNEYSHSVRPLAPTFTPAPAARPTPSN